MKRLRRYFVAGLLVWVPLGFTFFVLRIIVGLIDNLIPASYRPEALFGFHVPGLGIVMTAMVVLITGLLVANFVGKQMVGFWESMMERIPVVRTVYSAAKKFAEVLLNDSNDSFKKVLLIEYPRKGIYSLAFQTSTNLGEIQDRTGAEMVCTFVPTTPNPTSGLIIMVPRQDVIELDMEVDQALKMVISLGVVVPQWNRSQLKDLPLAPVIKASD